MLQLMAAANCKLLTLSLSHELPLSDSRSFSVNMISPTNIFWLVGLSTVLGSVDAFKTEFCCWLSSSDFVAGNTFVFTVGWLSVVFSSKLLKLNKNYFLILSVF